MKVCLDYGHGGKDSGAYYKGRKEADDVLVVGQFLAQALRVKGVLVYETRKNNDFVSLSKRCSIANKVDVDYFISIHRNAYYPEKARGVETYIHPSGSYKARKLAQRCQDSMVELGFKNRGVKKANFYVLRKTKSPAILIELGFIDNSKDNQLFSTNKKEIARRLANAVVTN